VTRSIARRAPRAFPTHAARSRSAASVSGASSIWMSFLRPLFHHRVAERPVSNAESPVRLASRSRSRLCTERDLMLFRKASTSNRCLNPSSRITRHGTVAPTDNLPKALPSPGARGARRRRSSRECFGDIVGKDQWLPATRHSCFLSASIIARPKRRKRSSTATPAVECGTVLALRAIWGCPALGDDRGKHCRVNPDD